MTDETRLDQYDTKTIIDAAYRLFVERHNTVIVHGGDSYERFVSLMMVAIRMNEDEQEPTS